MSSIKSLCRVGQMSVRRFATDPIPKDKIHPGFFRLKEIQKLYQKPDGLPIHLKRGARDKVLYYIAVGGCFVGLAGIAEFIYSLP